MRISNIKDIYVALSQGQKIKLDDHGRPEASPPSPPPGLARLLSRVNPSSSPIPTSINDDSALLSLAGIVVEEGEKVAGPQDLTQPLSQLYAEGVSFEETLEKAKKILGEAMVKAHVDALLKDTPEPVVKGATELILSRWQSRKEGGGGFPEVKAFVDQQLQTLKENSSLEILACGFTRGPEDLKNETAFLERSLKDVVLSTWSSKKSADFSESGVYSIFVKDSGRERSIVFDQRLSREDFNNEDAGSFYGDLLVKNFNGNRSMVGVVGVLMSQTSMATQAEMIMGLPPFPLNPYVKADDTESKDIMALVVENPEDQPRSILTQTKDHISIRQKLTFNLTCVSSGRSAVVGGLDYVITLPKDQFPLPMDSDPRLTVSEMIFDKQKAYAE